MNLNSWFFYLVAGGVLCVVLAQSLFFMLKAYKEGLRIGMSKTILNRAISSSVVFSVLPSFGVLVTLFGLIKFLGIPFSWLRLTVIGSIYYELGAADTVAQHASGASLTSLTGANMTAEIFSTIAIVMSAGILMGGLLCIFGLKKYASVFAKTERAKLDLNGDIDTQNKDKDNPNTDNSKSKMDKLKGVGEIAFTAMFIGLCSAYIGSAFGKAFGGFKIDSYTSVVPLLSMLFAVLTMAVMLKLEKKYKWVQSFSLSFAMLAGMVSAIPFSLILGAIFG